MELEDFTKKYVIYYSDDVYTLSPIGGKQYASNTFDDLIPIKLNLPSMIEGARLYKSSDHYIYVNGTYEYAVRTESFYNLVRRVTGVVL